MPSRCSSTSTRLPSTWIPAGIAAALTPRTKAILCVHQIGMPCDLARILPLARAHGLLVIEDAACATGSEILLDGAWRGSARPRATSPASPSIRAR